MNLSWREIIRVAVVALWSSGSEQNRHQDGPCRKTARTACGDRTIHEFWDTSALTDRQVLEMLETIHALEKVGGDIDWDKQLDNYRLAELDQDVLRHRLHHSDSERQPRGRRRKTRERQSPRNEKRRRLMEEDMGRTTRAPRERPKKRREHREEQKRMNQLLVIENAINDFINGAFENVGITDLLESDNTDNKKTASSDSVAARQDTGGDDDAVGVDDDFLPPTSEPTFAPTVETTSSETLPPSQFPSTSNTQVPSSLRPTLMPSSPVPTSADTTSPSVKPSTSEPSVKGTMDGTIVPTGTPTTESTIPSPTIMTTTMEPNSFPTEAPGGIPTATPTTPLPASTSPSPTGSDDDETPSTSPIENDQEPDIPGGGTGGDDGIPIPIYRYGTGNCPDDGDSRSAVPCAPDNLQRLCDKYDDENMGKFSACFEACRPSFCCIHDADPDLNFIAPNCNQDVNCAGYAYCYIVWWKLHDTIGQAQALRLEQSDDFFDEDASFISGDVSNVDFFRELLFHHFDDAAEIIELGSVEINDTLTEFQSNRIFLNETYWDTNI